jgi:heme A synthase
MVILFLLGGLQGFIGWFMVKADGTRNILWVMLN